jgi:hypothetical protein
MNVGDIVFGVLRAAVVAVCGVAALVRGGIEEIETSTQAVEEPFA